MIWWQWLLLAIFGLLVLLFIFMQSGLLSRASATSGVSANSVRGVKYPMDDSLYPNLDSIPTNGYVYRQASQYSAMPDDKFMYFDVINDKIDTAGMRIPFFNLFEFKDLDAATELGVIDNKGVSTLKYTDNKTIGCLISPFVSADNETLCYDLLDVAVDADQYAWSNTAKTQGTEPNHTFSHNVFKVDDDVDRKTRYKTTFDWGETKQYDTQYWTLEHTRFRDADEIDDGSATPYGYTTGVYKVDLKSFTQEMCTQGCVDDKMCHTSEWRAVGGICTRSTLPARLILRYFGGSVNNKEMNGTLYDNSPFMKEEKATTTMIVRTPIVLTGAHNSACDCNTLCGIQEMYPKTEPWFHHESNGYEGASCLGTLTSTGMFMPRCDIAGSAALVRWEEWEKTGICGLNATCGDLYGATPMSVGGQTHNLGSNNDVFHAYLTTPSQKFCVCSGNNNAKLTSFSQTAAMFDMMTTQFTCPIQVPDVDDFSVALPDL